MTFQTNTFDFYGNPRTLHYVNVNEGHIIIHPLHTGDFMISVPSTAPLSNGLPIRHGGNYPTLEEAQAEVVAILDRHEYVAV